MNKITEIVFGDSLCRELKNSSFSRDNEIIKFGILFSVANFSSSSTSSLELNMNKEYIPDARQSLDNIENRLEVAFQNNSKIRIWTTHKQVDSYLMFLYTCSYFRNKNYDLYVLFSDEYDQHCYSPSCMVEKELEELAKIEHKLSKEEIDKYASKWEQVVKCNSEMRVIENNEIKNVSLDYYNDIILDKLREFGQVETVVLIGNLMRDIHLFDSLFMYLVERLIELGDIIVVKREDRLWKSVIKVMEKN